MVVDPSAEAAKLVGAGVTVVASVADIPHGFAPEAVVLAVKPQMARGGVAGLCAVRRAARYSFPSWQARRCMQSAMLGVKAATVRAMPNTPAAVRQGITVAVAGVHVSPHQQALANELLAATGQISWVGDEALLDP
jgi:pyrroline-5-carboxylate reductase